MTPVGSSPVTNDGLNAGLAGLELRLVREIQATVKPVSDAVESFARGEFNDAQRLAVEQITEGVIGEKTSLKWTAKSRALAVIGTILAAGSMCAAVTVAIVAVFS